MQVHFIHFTKLSYTNVTSVDAFIFVSFGKILNNFILEFPQFFTTKIILIFFTTNFCYMVKLTFLNLQH